MSEDLADQPKWVKAFLGVLAKTANISAACKAAKISRSTVYEHKENDEVFAAAWSQAEEEAVETLEKEAWRRARDGVKRKKGVYFMGAQVATEVETLYSDNLLMFLLKAHKPTRYRETTNQNINMNLAGQVELYIPDNGRDRDDSSTDTTTNQAENDPETTEVPGEVPQ